MSDTREKLLPGIEAYIEPGEKGFAKIQMLLSATGGLSLSQVCAVTGLEGSTIQNWVKRGWVAHPKGKRYEEVHIARILIINALKECIKLEHIAKLMNYVSGEARSPEDSIIAESELFNFLCDALGRMGSASGVEGVVEDVLSDYVGPTPDSRMKIRKTLTLMMYACVCTDVKRRTESMMRQILNELENPMEVSDNPEASSTEKPKQAQTPDTQVKSSVPAPHEYVSASEKQEVPEPIAQQPSAEQSEIKEKPKTIAQTLREWDVSSVERIIIDHDSDQKETEETKTVNRPWFTRRNK